MGGQRKSEASSLSSAEVKRLWEEPTEAIPQNQREAVGILSLQGEADVNWLILTVLCSRSMRAQTFLLWAPIIILQGAAARRDRRGELPSGLYSSPDVRQIFSPLNVGLSATGRAQPFIAYPSSNAVELQCSFWAREINLEICGIRDLRV